MENDAVPAKQQNNEALFKEIDLLEGCINRMADNSFKCKGWAITLVVAVLGLWCYDDFGWGWAAVICCIPLACFWYMDHNYLSLERKYRARYEWVLKNRPKGNMSGLFELNPGKFGPAPDDDAGNGSRKRRWSEWMYPVLIIAVVLLIIAAEVL
ncbi:MAG: hypothetical protein ACOX8X_05885, partial [Methanomethylophilus sp.]|jgi:hypothetical protein